MAHALALFSLNVANAFREQKNLPLRVKSMECDYHQNSELYCDIQICSSDIGIFNSAIQYLHFDMQF